ncbi:MAG: hypothetical protein GXX96_18395 [Planctomycetaceae bacterium]|nr:hypothetical protein [Planctomycetaceae bacterium]
MRITTCLSVLLLLAGHAVPCHTAEQATSERVAATITPFLDEQTVIVAHLDLVALNIDDAVAAIGALLGEHATTGIRPVSETAQRLKIAGPREAYYLLSVADMPKYPGMIVVPLLDGSDHSGVRAVLEATAMQPGFRVEQIDRAMISAAPETLTRLKTLSPVSRPHLATALAAVETAPLKIVFTPPEYFRKVIEETLPELPEVIGGGPSTTLTAGLQWVAVGIELAPQPQVRIVVQSESAEAAVALAKKFGETCELLRKNEKARADMPSIDVVMPLLMPTVEGDRVVLALNVENGRLPKLIQALTGK